MKRSLETLPREPKVNCPRLDKMRPIEEHEDCPYCFGSAEEIEKGPREKFCDFDAEKDPLNFGFPTDASHISKG